MKGIRNISVRTALIGSLLLLAPAGSKKVLAQDEPSARVPSVSALLDTSRILIGDQIHFSLEVLAPRGASVQFPALTDTLTHGVEILETLPVDSQQVEKDILLYRSRYLVTSFDSGFHFFPAYPVVVSGSRGNDTLFSNSLSLEVLTIPPDSSVTIYDIKMPYRAPLTFREMLPWIGAGLAAVLLAIFVIRYFKRRKRGTAGPGKKIFPSEPAHVIAIRELEALEKEKLWQQGLVKVYHTRITEILRNYLERRYHIPALEQTTREIMDQLEYLGGVPSGSRNELQQILVLADLVKFAKFVPAPEENMLSMTRSIRFVQDTLAIDVRAGTGEEQADEAAPGILTGQEEENEKMNPA